MWTYAEAEARKDNEVMRRIREAETEDDFTTGMRFSDRGPHLVLVSFYPQRKWWICDADAAGRPQSERRPLTRDEYEKTHPIRL